MQKVITVTCTLHALKTPEPIETQYPILDEHLEAGYKVVQVIPIVSNSETSRYSLTFVLEKVNL